MFPSGELWQKALCCKVLKLMESEDFQLKGHFCSLETGLHEFTWSKLRSARRSVCYRQTISLALAAELLYSHDCAAEHIRDLCDQS